VESELDTDFCTFWPPVLATSGTSGPQKTARQDKSAFLRFRLDPAGRSLVLRASFWLLEVDRHRRGFPEIKALALEVFFIGS
jgi:hypothetical protein